MPRKPAVDEGLKGPKPKLTSAKDESHQAKHIEETARLGSSLSVSLSFQLCSASFWA
jgi:hypothetical protein